MSTTLFGLLFVLALLFAGVYGIGVMAIATALGFISHGTGARRLHLMGVLIVPLATGL